MRTIRACACVRANEEGLKWVARVESNGEMVGEQRDRVPPVCR